MSTCDADAWDQDWEESLYCVRPAGHPDDDGMGGHQFV